MTEEEVQVVGSWKRLKVLGKGGFGQVTLWHNVATNQYIALKKLRENDLHLSMKPKHKERWTKEVEIMNKLSHDNVVSAISLPDDLKSLASGILPVLAMEFCRLGDLRQVLARPENCCGLREPSVLALLKDVSAGLAYLHSCKVIHRDLKPDNIVLQEAGGRIVYKLIDLGYAKELDHNSLCESFVGTIQYVAPELFLGQSYTSSVDYWSLGLVAYEVMTGYRPFLPGFNPAQWMKTIQNKSRNVINVYQTTTGEIIHSTHMSPVTNVSRVLSHNMEKWLQLALDWNGQTRGRDIETKEVKIFDCLTDVTSRKTVKVFSVPTYEVLAYEVSADTTVLSLQGWLSRDCDMELDDQILLLPSGKALNSKGNLLHGLAEFAGIDSVVIFLYPSGLVKIRKPSMYKPHYVRELLEDPKKLLEYKHLKRSCSDSVFFLQTRANLYTLFIQALKVKIENIKQRTAAVQTLFEDVNEEWNQAESFSQFLVLSHKTDLENYIALRKAGELASSGLVQKWIQKVNDVETKLSELRTASNRNQQKLAVAQAKQNSANLEGSTLLQSGNVSGFTGIVEDGQKLWDRAQKIPRDVRGISMSNTDMVKVLHRCLELDGTLLKSPLLDLLCMQIAEAEEHLAKLVSPLTIWLKSTKIMRQIIENTQKERQKEVWALVMKGKTKEKPKEKSEPEVEKETIPKPEPDQSSFSPFHIPKTVHNDVTTPVEDVIVVKPDFKVMEPVSINSFKVNSLSQSFSNDTEFIVQNIDASHIISDNNQWRYRTQDLTQSCHQMMKEIQSLNWDFLNES